MKKFYNQLLTLAFVLICAVAAYGEQFPNDGSSISTGVVYDVPAFWEGTATFTPSTSGVLIQAGCPELVIEGLTPTFNGYGTYGQEHSWTVEKDKTYTIYCPTFIFDATKVVYNMESEQGVTVTELRPEENGELVPNANLTGEIYIRFNTNVIFESATLCAGDKEIVLKNKSTQPNTITLAIQEAMNSLYANGTLSPEGGDPIWVTLEGLQSVTGTLYNGDGKLTINYVSSPKIPDLIASTVPTMLKSYYSEDDPEGIWTLVFDANLMNDGKTFMSISCGNPQSEDMYYYEELLPEVDGATLTFDLRGKLRELNDYLMMQGTRYVAVKVNNVRDVDGYLANGNGQGNVGSYSYSLTFDYIEPEAVAYEFNPPTGSSLEGIDEIEIWFNNADLISFEGVEFYYNTDDGFKSEIVLNSELEMELSNNEMTILCQVPEGVKGHDQITVRLYNLTSTDGHTYDISAEYDQFVVDLIYPIKAGDAIASTGTEDFVFKINQTLLYFYLRYDFYNGEGENGWIYGSELHKQSNGTWTGYNGNFPCYTNFEPYLVVSAYYNQNDFNNGEEPAETYVFKFIGTSQPFSFSSVKFVSIDPAPNTEIQPSDDFCFTVEYDGLVKINQELSGIILGMGLGVMPFDRVEPIYDGSDYTEGYSNIWCLYPSPSYLQNNSAIDISIFARDIDGAVVEGNLGAGENDCLQVSYAIQSTSNMIDITVTPEGGTVDHLSEFIISCNGYDVALNYGYDPQFDGNPDITDINFETIYTFSQDDFTKEDGSFDLIMTCPEITENGMYFLWIPEGYFLIGEQYEVYFNNLFYGMYTVDSSSSISSIITDSSTYEVYNMQGINIINTTDRSALNHLHGLYIVNGKKVYLK